MAAIQEMSGALDVRGIRLGIGGKIGATQETFAHVLGIPVKTLRNWEQQRRQPTGAARVLLMIVARNPSVLETKRRSASGVICWASDRRSEQGDNSACHSKKENLAIPAGGRKNFPS